MSMRDLLQPPVLKPCNFSWHTILCGTGCGWVQSVSGPDYLGHAPAGQIGFPIQKKGSDRCMQEQCLLLLDASSCAEVPTCGLILVQVPDRDRPSPMRRSRFAVVPQAGTQGNL